MEQFKMIYNKAEKKHLGVIILLQSALLILLFVVLAQKSSPNFSTNAAQSTFSEEITQDAKACLSLEPEARPACAKAAGVKIATHTNNPSERLSECLKFRPYFVHDCQLGLQAQ